MKLEQHQYQRSPDPEARIALACLFLGLAILFYAAITQAGEAPAVPTAWWEELALGLGNVAVAAIIWALAHLALWLKNKSKNEYLAGVVVKTDDLAERIVQEIWQREVKAIKEAAKDGKLSPEEKARFKQEALDVLKSYLGKKGLAEVAKVAGADNIERYLATTLEAAVAGHADPS